MANVIIYDGETTYTGEHLSEGELLFGDYFGGSAIVPMTTVTMTGSVGRVGDIVNVTSTEHGGKVANSVATYEGYFLAGTAKILVFADGFLGTAFAISANGDKVPPFTCPVSLINGMVCFLRGSHIATPTGELMIEALRVGDLVATIEDGETVYRPVKWVGSRRVSVNPARADIESYPVRIRAGAFRDTVPHRDLLVTAEHSLFVEGRLIPARMLVNGSSILVDTSITEYEFFHLELDRHAILVAEGLEAESYLDTGNRSNFADTVVSTLVPDLSVHADHYSWAQDAAAPLAVDRETVEPIWAALVARAVRLGLTAPATRSIVNEPALRLVTENNMEIVPTLFDGSIYAFVVPGNVKTLRLESRSFRPSETVGPFLDDRRRLGVQIGRIGISEGRRRFVCDTHLTNAPLSGWHAVEGSGACRWTNGNALLPVDLSVSRGRSMFLDIEVLSAGPYFEVASAA